MPAPSIELLIEFTKDDDPRTRATAVAGLAKVADPRGYAPVLVSLFDPADEVRIAAATALGIFADARSFEPLAECLTDPCEQVGVNCAWALAQTPDTRCIVKLFEVVASEAYTETVRAAAATAIGERAELEGSDLSTSDDLIAQATEALLAGAASTCDDVRAASFWSIGHMPATPETLAACRAALADPHEWTLRYAIEALAHIGSREDAVALEALLDDEREEISTLAAQAIEMLR